MKQYLSGIGFKVVQEANQNSPGAEAGNGIVGVHYAAVKHRNPLRIRGNADSDWAELGGAWEPVTQVTALPAWGHTFIYTKVTFNP